MLIGFGIDLVDCRRIERILSRFGDTFLKRILTEEEIRIIPEKRTVFWVASRFAAKEASAKAFGTGFAYGIGWHNIACLTGKNGEPYLHFTGEAENLARKKGITSTHISLSHDANMAIAAVILEV